MRDTHSPGSATLGWGWWSALPLRCPLPAKPCPLPPPHQTFPSIANAAKAPLTRPPFYFRFSFPVFSLKASPGQELGIVLYL